MGVSCGLIIKRFVRVKLIPSQAGSRFSIPFAHYSDDLLWHGSLWPLRGCVWKVLVPLSIYNTVLLKLAELAYSIFNFMLFESLGLKALLSAERGSACCPDVFEWWKLLCWVLLKVLLVVLLLPKVNECGVSFLHLKFRKIMISNNWWALLIHLFLRYDLSEVLTLMVRLKSLIIDHRDFVNKLFGREHWVTNLWIECRLILLNDLAPVREYLLVVNKIGIL